MKTAQTIRQEIKSYLQNPNPDAFWNLISKYKPDFDFYTTPCTSISLSGSPTDSDDSTNEDDLKLAEVLRQQRRDTPFMQKLHLEMQNRTTFNRYFGWSYPSPNAVAEIKDFVGQAKIVEINAGRGIWAHLLQFENVKIIPTDSEPPNLRYIEVIAAEASTAVKTYLQPGDCLMTSWPDYMANYATKAVKLALDLGLTKLIYVGEPPGGCTGDDGFHEMVDQSFNLIKELSIPQWWGIHDRVYLYQRK